MRIEKMITKAAPDCYTYSPCQPLWKCMENSMENSMENIHADVRG